LTQGRILPILGRVQACSWCNRDDFIYDCIGCSARHTEQVSARRFSHRIGVTGGSLFVVVFRAKAIN
jgi:hypothetical protein